jgi:SAM-dependent methyltransferase
MLELLAEAGFGEDVFNARQHRSCELVDVYVLRLAIQLARDLGLEAALPEPRSAEELVAARGFAPAFRGPLAWLLEWLAADGLVERELGSPGPRGASSEVRYRCPGPLPEPGLAAARAEALAIDPSYAPTYAMLDEAAAGYRKVAAGEASGERALFSRVALWAGYFSNANGYYALNNRVAAAVVADRLPPAGGRVLEVGAGLGSATQALLDRLGSAARDLAVYRATEPVPFFRRRAERDLASRHPGTPLAFASLDVNSPWGEQGIAPASFDVVWGVNVFHLARRLVDVLREAHAALAPGGWLVAGDGMRPAAGAAVAAEFPFQLLDAFVQVELDPELRPSPGFLTAGQWRAAFAAAGFSSVAVVPDVAELVAVHAGFYAAAVCGRR